MDKIEGNSLDIEYLEDKLDEEEEEEDNDFEEKNMIIENPENFNNNDDESNYMDIENNNSDEYIRLDLNELLSNFSIDENEDDGETTIIFENLESYRQGEIRKLREDDDKKYVVTDKYTGDETFFLSQKSKSGRTLDCGYLYGERKDKKFIGFQIKCLFEKTTTIKKNAFKKDIIKRNLQKILINSLYLLNCRINEWYYYLIIYKNPTISKCNMNKQLFNKVQNFIEVILYDPLEKKFYDSKNKEIKTLPITEKANLDCVYDILDSYNLKQKHAIQKRDYKKLEKSFNKSFKFTEKENVTEIIKKISEIMDIKKTKIVELLCKCKINKFEYPNYDCIYLYPTSDKKIFYGMKTIKNKENKPEEIYYDLDREIKISSQLFYKDVNPSNSYVYILGIRNKVYNDLSVSSNYNSKGEKRFKSQS